MPEKVVKLNIGTINKLFSKLMVRSIEIATAYTLNDVNTKKVVAPFNL